MSAELQRVHLPGWTLHEYEELTSTSDVATRLPPWHAVRANRQTSGRGRWQRKWVSDAGGLWLSAVLPTGSPATAWRTLPLAVGLAVVEHLASLGVRGLRLRWPNDIMIGQAKLAGLLLEEPFSGVVIAGIGINTGNCPESSAPELRGLTTRLAEHLHPCPDLLTLACGLLLKLKQVRDEMDQSGFEVLLPRLQPWWCLPRRVLLDLGPQKVSGDFQGVDAQGRLGLANPHRGVQWFGAPQVVQLQEVL